MTTADDLLILGQSDVTRLLAGREQEVLGLVRDAYVAHHRKATAVPHSSFLRFPGNARDRIIALPAYLGEGFEVAGIKWIASFPGNIGRGLERASAVMILNSMATGRPQAVLEAGLVSARRTAASAALAASVLHGEKEPAVGLVGAGRIDFEITRFLATVFPQARSWSIFDLDRDRAAEFAARCRQQLGLAVSVSESLEATLGGSSLVSFATTAIEPHVADLSPCPPGTTVLHISLRDLAPELILAHDNVVDDLDHVCRAQTSIHLAAERAGHREFVRAEIGAVLAGDAAPRRDPAGITLFSPFGLGILDLALAHRVRTLAEEQGVGVRVPGFLETGTEVAAHR